MTETGDGSIATRSARSPTSRARDGPDERNFRRNVLKLGIATGMDAQRSERVHVSSYHRIEPRR